MLFHVHALSARTGARFARCVPSAFADIPQRSSLAQGGKYALQSTRVRDAVEDTVTEWLHVLRGPESGV